MRKIHYHKDILIHFCLFSSEKLSSFLCFNEIMLVIYCWS